MQTVFGSRNHKCHSTAKFRSPIYPILLALISIHTPLLSQHSATHNQGMHSIEVQDSSIICLPCNALQESPKLKKVLQKLHTVYLNNIISNIPNHPGTGAGTGKFDTLFTIIHIGDSHVQGDYFSGEIRRQLQGYFGNAGQGILFPYALAKSFGPRGTTVKPLGSWNGLKTLSVNLQWPLGVSGYGAITLDPKSSLQISLSEKFNEKELKLGIPTFQKINIWHSADAKSFTTQLSNDFHWTGSQFYPSGWGVSSYQSDKPTSSFNLSLLQNNTYQNYYGFYGFELIPDQQRGIVYHHCGVVGAQFTHLIEKAPWTIEQIAHLKPDILIFSFGTNEAYNGGLDTAIYTPKVQKFLEDLALASPQTAIILTTTPDTRSRNRIPPKQRATNNQLRILANREKITLYDLNTAMGGWGSLYTWHNHQLTNSDKLHFNAAGYALQGQLFSLSLLQAYNKVNFRDTLNISLLHETVQNSMKSLVRDFSAETLGDSSAMDSVLIAVDSSALIVAPQKKIPQKNTPPQRRSGEIIHIVKSGENLYRIGLQYHVRHEVIALRNHIKNPTEIRPGQKLYIPKR